MGMRVRLCKLTNVTQPSVKLLNDDPPFNFVVTGSWTGSVTVEQSVDDPTVADAAATWITMLTFAAPNDNQNWNNPIYRVRANLRGLLTGVATVDMLVGIRSLKNQVRPGQKNRKPTQQQVRRALA